jgi:hypothetical protein
MKIRQFIVWLNIPLPSGKASFPPNFHKLESYSQEYPFVKILKAQLWNLYPWYTRYRVLFSKTRKVFCSFPVSLPPIKKN